MPWVWYALAGVAVTLTLASLYAARSIMAQLDDLNAAVADLGGKVDAVAVEVSSISDQATGIKAEVEDLLAKLASGPVPTDLSGVIAAVQSIGGKMDALKSSADAAQAALSAVPAEPAPPAEPSAAPSA